MATHVIEWRLYRSRGVLSRAIGWRSNGGEGEFTHVDVLDPSTGWLWGAHSDAFKVRVAAVPAAYNLTLTPKGVHIRSGFYPRPPNYDAKHWVRVVAYRLTVGDVQYKRFWDFTEQQWGAPYDSRGLLDTYVVGRDWRSPGAWYCSEEQTAAGEYSFILRKLPHVEAVDPSDFALLLNQTGAVREDLPIPVPELKAAA